MYIGKDSLLVHIWACIQTKFLDTKSIRPIPCQVLNTHLTSHFPYHDAWHGRRPGGSVLLQLRLTTPRKARKNCWYLKCKTSQQHPKCPFFVSSHTTRVHRCHLNEAGLKGLWCFSLVRRDRFRQVLEKWHKEIRWNRGGVRGYKTQIVHEGCTKSGVQKFKDKQFEEWWDYPGLKILSGFWKKNSFHFDLDNLIVTAWLPTTFPDRALIKYWPSPPRFTTFHVEYLEATNCLCLNYVKIEHVYM